MHFLLRLEKLLSNFPYSSLSLNKLFILMQMLLVIFFILNYIQNPKALSSFTTFFIKPFFRKFLGAFPRCAVGRKTFVCTRENEFLERFPFVFWCGTMLYLGIHGRSLKIHAQVHLFTIFNDLLAIKPMHTFEVNI